MMQTEDRLIQVLQHEGGAFRPPVVSFDDIQSRARAIRRRRTTVTAGLGSLGLAVVVGAAVTLGTSLPGRAPEGSPVAQISIVPGPSGDPTAPLPLDRIQQGAPPRIDYAFASTLTHADGTIESPPWLGSARSFLAYTEGWLVLDDQGVLTHYSSTGAVTSSGRSTTSGNRAAVLDHSEFYVGYAHDKTVTVGPPTAKGELTVAVPDMNRFVGFLTGHRVVYSDHSGSAKVITFAGKVRDVPAPVTAVIDASPGQNLISAVSATGRVIVIKPDGTIKWTMPLDVASAGRFNSDGRLLWTRSQGANGSVSVAIHDALSGDRLTHFRLTDHHLELLGEPVWEDSSHLLLALREQGTTSVAVVRFGADRSIVRATPVDTSAAQRPFIFSVSD